jgi:hypothetical protein
MLQNQTVQRSCSRRRIAWCRPLVCILLSRTKCHRKNGSKFGKISENPKNVRQKKMKKIPNPRRYTRYLHINAAATFVFRKNIFFRGKVGKNIFWPPGCPRLPPVTPGSVLQNVGLFEGSTVGPQKNPKVPFPGQKSGAAGIFLFWPKWTNGARADFWAHCGGFFLSFAKIGSKFGKISENPKNVGQK